MNEENTEKDIPTTGNDNDATQAAEHAAAALVTALTRSCELYRHAERLAAAVAEGLVGLRMVARGKLPTPADAADSDEIARQAQQALHTDPTVRRLIEGVAEFMMTSSTIPTNELADKVRAHVEALVAEATQRVETDVPD